MENITTTAELRHAIRTLEIERLTQIQILEDQARDILEDLKPVNLIANTLNELSTMPVFANSIVGPVAGLTTGYLTRKLIVGLSGNLFTRMLGTLVQFGVTNLVSRHPDMIKTFGKQIFQRIFQKTKTISASSNQQSPDIY